MPKPEDPNEEIFLHFAGSFPNAEHKKFICTQDGKFVRTEGRRLNLNGNTNRKPHTPKRALVNKFISEVYPKIELSPTDFS